MYTDAKLTSMTYAQARNRGVALDRYHALERGRAWREYRQLTTTQQELYQRETARLLSEERVTQLSRIHRLAARAAGYRCQNGAAS